MTPRPWVTQREAAERLHVHVNTVGKMLRDGRLTPGESGGAGRRVDAENLARIEAQREKARVWEIHLCPDCEAIYNAAYFDPADGGCCGVPGERVRVVEVLGSKTDE